MHYKTNRLNHDFQIAYFLAGSCHTPDAAYSLLCDLKEDRNNAIKSYRASKLREQAKIIRAKRLLKSKDEAERLEGKADIAEIEAMAETTERNYQAALAEIATIDICMQALEPLRKYKHLPAPAAHEAAQSEEWKLELIHRAENCLLTTGAISTDHFATMRMHPEFQTEILPAIEEIQLLMSQPNGRVKLLGGISKRKFYLPDLLPEKTSGKITPQLPEKKKKLRGT